MAAPKPGTLIYQCPCNAELYISASEESEPALTADGALTITDPGQDAPYRAQCGDVYWSLGRDVACMCVNHGTYSFSVPESPGLFITVVLDTALQGDDLDLLQSMLASTTTFHVKGAPPNAPPAQSPLNPTELAARHAAGVGVQGPEQPPPQAATKYDKMADGIVSGGTAVGHGVRVAAQAVVAGIAWSATTATKHLSPSSQPTQVSPQTMQRLESFSNMANKAAQVTGRVAEGVAKRVANASVGVAKTVANSGLVQGIASATGTKSGLEGMARVGAAGIEALEQVFESLEEAGVHVAKSLQSNSTLVVNHKYGPQAAGATQVGMGAAVSVVEARRNLHALRPTRMARHAIKHTAKHSVQQAGGRPVAVTIAAAPAAAPGAPSAAVVTVTSANPNPVAGPSQQGYQPPQYVAPAPPKYYPAVPH